MRSFILYVCVCLPMIFGGCSLPRAAILTAIAHDPVMQPPHSSQTDFKFKYFPDESPMTAGRIFSVAASQAQVMEWYQTELPEHGWRIRTSPEEIQWTGGGTIMDAVWGIDSADKDVLSLGLLLIVQATKGEDENHTKVVVAVRQNDFYALHTSYLVYRIAASGRPWPSGLWAISLGFLF